MGLLKKYIPSPLPVLSPDGHRGRRDGGGEQLQPRISNKIPLTSAYFAVSATNAEILSPPSRRFALRVPQDKAPQDRGGERRFMEKISLKKGFSTAPLSPSSIDIKIKLLYYKI